MIVAIASKKKIGKALKKSGQEHTAFHNGIFLKYLVIGISKEGEEDIMYAKFLSVFLMSVSDNIYLS